MVAMLASPGRTIQRGGSRFDAMAGMLRPGVTARKLRQGRSAYGGTSRQEPTPCHGTTEPGRQSGLHYRTTPYPAAGDKIRLLLKI